MAGTADISKQILIDKAALAAQDLQQAYLSNGKVPNIPDAREIQGELTSFVNANENAQIPIDPDVKQGLESLTRAIDNIQPPGSISSPGTSAVAGIGGDPTQHPPVDPGVADVADDVRGKDPRLGPGKDIRLGLGNMGSVKLNPVPGSLATTIPRGSDDSISYTRSTGVPIADAFKARIETKPNQLNALASYTYQISIYMCTPDQFNILLGGSARNVNGLSCILSSGGQPLAPPMASPNYSTLESIYNKKDYSSEPGGATRNKHFDFDYFINNLRLTGIFAGKDNQTTNTTSFSFTITEPYGFTLFARLKMAWADLLPGGPAGFDKQHYLMVIRFYGYDEQGTPMSPDQSGHQSPTSDPGSLTERFIPFMFTEAKTQVKANGVEYQCKGVVRMEGQKRSTIPFNLELAGASLEDIFNGPSKKLPDPKAPAPNLSASKQGAATVTQGIVPALNEHQRLLVGKSQDHPDTYKVTFEPGSKIGEYKIRPPGESNSQSPMNQSGSRPKPDAGSVDKNAKTMQIIAGTQLSRVIAQAILGSEYIYAQQLWQIIDGKPVQNTSANPITSWFHISTRYKMGKWDTKRNDYAYDIEYIITPKQISLVSNQYFNPGSFKGVHKKYNHWFTGQNTDIIQFEQNINSSYYTTFDSQVPTPTPASDTGSQTYAPNSEANSQGGNKGSGNAAGSAAALLNSAADWARSTMTIVGDPDFIQQSEVFDRPDLSLDSFMPDGSINFDSGEVLYEVIFNTIEDFNENTGEFERKKFEVKSKQQVELTGTPGLIYQLYSITSTFKDGSFTQELQGTQKSYSPVSSDSVRPLTTDTPNKAKVNAPTKSKLLPAPRELKSGEKGYGEGGNTGEDGGRNFLRNLWDTASEALTGTPLGPNYPKK